MAVPNDTTKFELAFLIFWIILTFALLVLAGLRKLALPNLIKGDKTVSILCVFLQLVTFVLLLAALALDQWTRHGGSGWLAYGVTSLHTGNGDRFDYDCDIDGASTDQKNYCRTIQTAGAFVLIFGLVAIITSFSLLVLASMNLAGQFQLQKFHAHVPTLANIQWIALQGMVMIWGVSGHDPIKQAENSNGAAFRGIGTDSSWHLGDSWALAFVCTCLAITVCFFFAGGPGESATGATSLGPAAQSHHDLEAAQVAKEKAALSPRHNDPSVPATKY